MPLRLVRSASNEALWNTCTDRFLSAVAASPGPSGHPAHLWITQRELRDSLLEMAHGRGVYGWLAPPFSFFSELPERFGLGKKATGLLTRRRMVARLAASHASRLRLGVSGDSGIIRGHMIDGFLGELLPEGVSPGRLERGLSAIAGDDFATRRNEWIVSVYRDYLKELENLGQFDPRSVHALLAEAIDRGGLPTAVGAARVLHIYGLYTFRSRERLITSLARQRDIDVVLYTLAEDEPGEWDDLARRLGLETEYIEAPVPTEPVVQPAPDALREYGWVAQQVKRRLVLDGLEPHEIAIVAREGREDTRRACAALEAAGIPCTARVRMPLSEIGALKALLELFRGAAEEWSYRPLRNFLTSPYFMTNVDLRAIDFATKRGRPQGMRGWAQAIAKLADSKQDGSSREAREIVVHHERLRRDAAQLEKLAEELAFLSESRSEAEWVRLTAELVTTGILGYRIRASRPVGNRWDLVRFDQRGIRQLERLLKEWSELDLPPDPLTTEEWYRLLQRLLEANELALSTPGQKGVQVVEAQDAALLPYKAVFLTHANDGTFPRIGNSRGVLLEEERIALRTGGLPIADREVNLRRERTLWRASVQGDQVVITYRTTDPSGTPLLPSLMVPEHPAESELPRSWEPQAGADEVTSLEQDRRLAAIRLRQTATTGDLVPTADIATLGRAIVAAHGEVRRGVRNRRGQASPLPNPWQGELREPFVLEELGRRFGPDHVWSVSQLENYALSPFVFLLNRVLRLQEIEVADEETSALLFGGVAHDILRAFYDATLDELPHTLTGEAQAIFDRIADEVLARRETSGEWLGLPSLWSHTRQEIRERVRDYVTWELDYMAQKKERPIWCELELGSYEEPAVLTGYDISGSEQTIRFTGRVDRVDLCVRGGVSAYHVLDYKTSSVPKASGYRDGSVLQGAFYLYAIETLKQVRIGSGRYRPIRRPGSPANGCEVKSTSDDYRTALQIAFSIPGRIRRGYFEPAIAVSQDWLAWHPGIEVTRTRAKAEGNRFHG